MNHRTVMVGSLVALCCAGTGRTAAAQTTVAAAQASSDARKVDELLRRPVTLDLNHVPLSQAIDAAAASAKIVIQYRAGILKAYDALVTLQVKNVPLEVALSRIFAGTSLVVVPEGTTRLMVADSKTPGESPSATGIIKGVVRNTQTQLPVPSANVSVEGNKLGARTEEDGTFQIAGLPAGTYRVIVRRLGYHVRSVAVTVRDDSTSTISVLLTPVATVLNDVVTTATGDRKRFEVGNAVGTIKADSIVPTTLIRNVSDLLQSRVPGVVVSNTDGAVGAPSRIRLRGLSSLSLNNDPIIIVDGVRLNAQTTSASLQTNVGSQQMLGQLATVGNGPGTAPLAPSRLDDIDPNTIESIDVLRGPSASSLYGTDAANGVIVIKTKRGRAGSWRVSLLGDYGQSAVPGTFPERWVGWGRQNGNQETASCYLAANGITVAGGGCLQDSVTQFNPQNYAPMQTLGTGTSKSMSASLSGGTESLQQFLSGRVTSNVGVAKMSDVEQRIIARYWTVAPPSWMVRPNTEQNVDGTSRTTFNVSPTTDVSLSLNGIYRNVLNGGSGIQLRGFGTGLTPGDTLSYLPSENQRTQVTSTEKRGTLAATANARPLSWLALTATGGGDYGTRIDQANLSAQFCTPALSVLSTGSNNCPSGRKVSRGETFVTTANGGASLSFVPFRWLTLRTALGEQYSHTSFYNLQVGNTDATYCPLAFGSTLLSPSPVCLDRNQQQYALTESRDESATAGIYIEETITAFGLFYTVGVRRDLASAFGSQVTNSPPKFPKLNLSYPVSDQSYFPKQPYVTSLRLRLAYGQSGNQASQTAVLNNYQSTNVTFVGSPQTTAIDLTALGNADLQPEKSIEWEGGFDVSFLENERVHLETTLYRKFTRNMITSVPLTPSLGNYSLFYNLGNVDNRGVEVGLTARVIDTRLLGWDLSINGSKNTNKLVHKAPSLPPYGQGGTQFVEGFPLYGFWGVPVESYADANGDKILSQDEITFGQLRYMGAPYPKGTVTYGSSVSLWNGALRVSANLYQIIGQTTALSTDNGFVPRAAVDRTAPLSQQAAFVQAYANNRAYIGTSSSIRLNEMSATYIVPVRLIRGLHAQSLSVTLAGRNLGLWSSYAGKDPNVDTSGLLGEVATDNGLATPQPRTWALRFNLGL